MDSIEEVFFNNSILSKAFACVQNRFKVGDLRFPDRNDFEYVASKDLLELMNEYVQRSLMKSARDVDQVLINFVKLLKK